MLRESDRRLLTARVDGELSARQHRQLRRLLRHSQEARRLLARLQEDRQRLGTLPAEGVAQDLSYGVLRAIAARGLAQSRGVPPVSAGISPWLGLTGAAGFLLCLGLASFVYFRLSLTHDQGASVARTDSSGLLNPSRVPKSQPRAMGRSARLPRKPAPPSPPIRHRLHALEQDDVRQEFMSALHSGQAYRIELPCRNGPKAWEHLRVACQAVGVAVLMDQAAREFLRRGDPSLCLAIYLDNVLPEELARLLSIAGRADGKNAADNVLPAQFDRFAMSQIEPEDRNELSILADANPTVAGTRARSGALEGIPYRQTAEPTAKAGAESRAGQGSRTRPAEQASLAPPARLTALVFACGVPLSHSSEMRQYLESRQAGRPGAVRVLLVLRG